MLKLIDRQLIRGFLKAYLVCLVSLLSLYIVVDLFTNLDDFTRTSPNFATTLKWIGVYYGYKVTQIFDRLCEAILLMSAMFTVAWMQRNNEIMPLLSAGVSTRRIVAPVIVAACVTLLFTLVNQEVLIPHIGMRLMFQRDDPDGIKDTEVRGTYEPNGIHIEGSKATRRGMIVREFRCTIPESLAGSLGHITASEARYVPPGPGPRTGGWELSGTKPEEIETWDPVVFEPIDRGKYFLRVKRADFRTVTRHPNAYQLSSTYQLYRELQNADAGRMTAGAPDRKQAVLFHMRLTRPILGVLLIFLGLSVILKDHNRNVVLSTGLCLVLCAVFFGITYVCKLLGDNNHITPPLAAWLPVLVVGPFALVKFDAVHT